MYEDKRGSLLLELVAEEDHATLTVPPDACPEDALHC